MRYLMWILPRRAPGMVEATRWLFAVLALASLPLALLGPLSTAGGVMKLVALASTVVLGLSISGGYLRRGAPLWMDVLDALAILAFALACPHPIAAAGIVFSQLWFRSLYGSTARALLRCGLYAGAIATSLPLWQLVPGHAAAADIGPLIGSLPTMFLTVIVGRHLAGILGSREQSAQRDAVHVSAGAQLLGVTDAAEIRRIAWEGMAGICTATPGLRVMKVVKDKGSLHVEAAAGSFADVPQMLPAAVLSVQGDSTTGCEMVQSRAELDTAAGTACVWACVPVPQEHDQYGVAWLLVGSPRKMAPEALVSVVSLENVVTLALRNAQVHEELRLQAELDGLTGLANRTTFNAAVLSALDDESARYTSVLFVDIDDFKGVNDRFGHGAGDDLLREVGARLRRAIRPGDLCARLGGDEFAVLLHGTSGVAAADVAQRIVQAIAVAAHIGGGVAHVGASVGVATATGKTDLEQLIHRADVAMYAAKANGKSRIQVFEPGLLDVDSAKMGFERELSTAADNGELIVHYQPVLSLPDGRCTAVEALARWQHPERGLLYPESFIEAAERSGAIGDIGAFVLRRACADTATWRDAHPGSQLAVHVNISALQLDDDAFIDRVMACLKEFTLDPHQLVLEITETIVIASPVAIDRLNTLAAHGVTIAIDDFGTGYSALTTLRSLPVQIVKIDKSFVAGSTENPEDRAVTEAVVKMAAQMGMRTIAEGVERPEQQAFLETIGADAVQGYLYLRPTTAEKFGAWLAAHLAAPARTQPTRTQLSGNVVIPFTPRQTA